MAFGNKSPLFQEAGETDGGGGFLQGLRNLLPAGNNRGDALPELSVEPVAFSPLDAATEAEPGAAAEDLGVGTGLEGEEQTAPSFFVRTPKGKPPQKPKQQKGPFQAVGKVSPGLPPVQAAVLRAAQERQRDALRARGLAELGFGVESANAQRTFEEIARKDFEAMREVVENDLPRWKAAREQLNRDVDEARQMRVNPYNFMQSVGRAGRVTSAISVAVGQLAAGAGNPNSSLQMIKAAVDRDISAQRDNINLAFRGIEAKSGLINEEVELAERQFLFEAQARAVASTAIAAQLGAAKQEVANESQRIAIEMMETNFLADSLIQKGIADAQMFSILVDGRLQNRAQALRLQEEVQRLNEGLQPDGQPVGEVQLQELPFQQRAAETAAELGLGAPAQGVPPTAAPPTAAAEPVAAPSAPLTRAERAGTRRAPGREVSVEIGPVEVGEQALKNVPEGNVVPEPIEDRPTGVVAPTSAPEILAVNEIPSDEEIRAEVDRVVGNDRVLQAGSFAQDAATRTGAPAPFAVSLVDGIKAVGNNWIMDNGARFPGFSSVEDAQAAAVVIDKLFRPRRGQYETDGQFSSALAQHNYTINNPELLEAFTTERFGDKNESNNIRVGADGRRIRLSRDSDARIDPKLRQELKKQVTDTYQVIEDVRTQAEAIRDNGSGSILGFRFTDKGLTFTPFDPEKGAEAALIQNRFLDLGIGYMKRVDPSGRLTEQDIAVGKAYWAGLAGGVAKTWDAIQASINAALGKKFSETQVRQSITRFMQSMALSFSDRTMRQIGGEFVIPWEEKQRQQKQTQETRRWMDSLKAE